MIGVLLNESSRGDVLYGPFADGDVLLAERFAVFLNDEVDPARLVRVNATDDLLWRSPLIELLNWREAMQRTARNVVPIEHCPRCCEDRPVNHICPVAETALRRHLHAIADQIHPTNGTAPDAPGAAYDAPMKGDAS